MQSFRTDSDQTLTEGYDLSERTNTDRNEGSNTLNIFFSIF